MWSPERVAGTVIWLAALCAPASAADPGRLDLLAAEIARLAAAPSPVQATAVPWAMIVALFAGTMLAAFLGTYAGARRQLLRGGKDWRELTYRFRAGKPLRLKKDTLARLNGLLGDLEELGTDLRKVSGGAVPAPAAGAPTVTSAPASSEGDAPAGAPDEPRPGLASVLFPRGGFPRKSAAPTASSAPPRRDRRTTYERARRLLEKGHDVATIRELTGLKTAELDLLRAAPAGARR
jgi:hypothetical protein